MSKTRQWKKSLLIFVLVGPTCILHSCSTMLGTSVRDAAIGGAATFVEAATIELLNRWFGSNAEE